MQITCPSCNLAINLADDKLPKDKAFLITCPVCQEKTKVSQHLRSSTAEHPSAEAENSPKDAIDTTTLVESSEFEDDEEDQIIYDENDKIALVLDETNQPVWTKELEAMDFKIQFPKSPEHGAYKMRFTQFHIIILNASFKGVPLAENVVYHNLLEMQMTTRRKMFVILIGKNFKSTNNMQAFAASVNLVINQKDVGKFSSILKRGLGENELFYKVFKETMNALGKI